MAKLLVLVVLGLFGSVLSDGKLRPIVTITPIGPVCNSEACKAVSKEMSSYMNLAANPCEDFYEYSCGNFHKYRPVDKSMFHLRMEAFTNETAEALNDLHEYQSNSTAVQFLTKLYHQCKTTDTKTFESLKKAIKELHEVQGDWTDLIAKVVGHFGVPAFLKVQLQAKH